MSYKTPHHAHEYIKAAALLVIHQYRLAFMGSKTPKWKKKFLLARREMDFHARVAAHFGANATLGAQGSSVIDIQVPAPLLNVEVKYLRKKPKSNQPANSHRDVYKDWNWLLGLSSAGNSFKASCWLVFLPSKELFEFDTCFTIPKKVGGKNPGRRNYAPFVELVEPTAANPRKLKWISGAWERDVLLYNKSKYVRRQIIGSPDHAVWAIIYSRLGTVPPHLEHLPECSYE